MRRIALALLVVPFALAACGGGGSSSNKTSSTPTVAVSPAAYVRQAAHKTVAAPSEHMELQATAGVAGQSVTMSGSGDFDNAKRAGTLHMSFSVGGASAAGAIDEVMTGTTVYLKSPLFSAALPQGKTWMKIDLQKAGAVQGIDLSALLSQSPAESVGELQGSTDVTKVGQETIDGVSTTHYRGRIDVSKVPQAAQIEARTNAKYGPYDVWIDDATGYVRRVKMSMSMAPAGTPKASMSFQMDFSDFGKTVTVQAPPDSQTFDATSAALKGLAP